MDFLSPSDKKLERVRCTQLFDAYRASWNDVLKINNSPLNVFTHALPLRLDPQLVLGLPRAETTLFEKGGEFEGKKFSSSSICSPSGRRKRRR
ncbi:hypothetical protein K435DRAFT_780793 [Dendrothele bispora CBS 962.96]|uniref:Uncharacterized protein n=1 Tax=Dendrothele bispora (strain CBS 962.96) TaxID=1314807 RepID=A0A4V4HEM1_DENBC|nr:hypothetical protein K435DRAFT_780793 [Dendrothele bispora CBS 962.96]